MRKWILFLIAAVVLSGCLNATLSPEERSACARLTDASTSVPSCTSLSACNTALARFESGDVGNLSGVSGASRQSQNDTAKTWYYLNQAVQQLQTIHQRCEQGNTAGIWDLAQQAGNELSLAFQASEHAQVEALQTLQVATAEAGEKGLEEVRDTAAFKEYATNAKMLQELQNGQETTALTKQIAANKNYFLSATSAITQNPAQSYSIDTSNALNALKTPVRLSTTATQARAIIAFFPVWQSMISSIWARNNVAKGLQLLDSIHAGELIRHVDTAVVPQSGVQFLAIQRVEALENGLRQLQAEETRLAQEGNTRLQTTRQALDEWNEQTPEIGIAARLRQWMDALRLAEPQDVTRVDVENEWSGLSFEFQKLQHAMEFDEGKWGARVSKWRDWSKALGSLENELKTKANIGNGFVQGCEAVAATVEKNSAMSDASRVIAKAMVAAGSGNREGLCTQLLQQMDLDASLIGADTNAASASAELESCVTKWNDYADALNTGQASSSAQWMAENGSIALAAAACKSAELHLEQIYRERPSAQEMESAAEALAKWQAIAQRWNILAQKNIGSDWSKRAQGLQEKSKFPLGGKEIEAWNAGYAEVKKQFWGWWQAQLQEEAQLHAWKIISPIPVMTNLEGAFVAEWSLENPVGIPLDEDLMLDVPLPMQANGSLHVEANAPYDTRGDKIGLALHDWEFEPIHVRIGGSGVLATHSVEWKKVEMMGTTAHAEVEILVDARVFPARVEVIMPLPVPVQEAHAADASGAKEIAVVRDINGLRITGETSAAQTMWKLSFSMEHAIACHTELMGQTEEAGVSRTHYSVQCANPLDSEVAVDVDSGVRADAIEVLSVQAFDESGSLVEKEFGAENALIIVNQKIGPHQLRKWDIEVVANAGVETWQAQVETLDNELMALAESPVAGVASGAQSLRIELAQTLLGTDSKKLASGLPGWVERFEKLRAQEKVELDKRAAEDAAKVDTNAFTDGNGMREMSLQDWQAGAKKRGDALLSAIIALGKGVDDYETEQSVTCAKLLETGFVCPLSESTRHDLRENAKQWEKDARATEKVAAGKEIGSAEKTQVEYQLNELQGKVDEAAQLIATARNALSENAQLVMQKLDAQPDASADWINGKEKARVAWNAKEYGKTIYVGRNLLNYAQGKTSALSGLSVLPDKAWPLAGVILLVGGAGAWKWWKKKNTPAPVFRSIPQKEEVTFPAQETRDSAHASPGMREEFQ